MPISISLTLNSTISEDGVIMLSSAATDVVRVKSDHTIIGTTSKTREIIDRFNLNNKEEVEFRKRIKMIQSFESKATEEYLPAKQYKPILAFTYSLSELAGLNRIQDLPRILNANFFRMMIYSNAISSFETFISDYLVKSISENPKLLQSLFANLDQLQKEKNSSIRNESGKIDELEFAVNNIQSRSFHNLSRIKKYFDATFNIQLPIPENLKDTMEIRHDIIHRNGYHVDTEKRREFTKPLILQLLLDLQEYVLVILTTIKNRPST